MNENNEIEIYYRWCKRDKKHEYAVVCRQRNDTDFGNYWIWWLWYRMGENFTKREKKQFSLFPYNCKWDENERLIKSYKTVNTGTTKVVSAIRNHFKKIIKH